MSELAHPNPSSGVQADVHLERLLVAGSVEEPWYKSLVQNIQDTIRPPKLPPLEVTSKPVAVKDIWGLYGRKKESWLMSTAFQAGVVALVLFLSTTKAVQEKVKEAVTLVMPADLAPPPPIPKKTNVMQ